MHSKNTGAARATLPDLCAALCGAVVRLHLSPLPSGPRAIVAVAATHEAASPEVLTDRGVLACLLAHEEGVTRPDAKGRAMLAEVVRQQGTALLAFATVGDAALAHGWLRALASGRANA